MNIFRRFTYSCLLATLAVTSACGGDGTEPPPNSGTVVASPTVAAVNEDPTAEPHLVAPASQYSLVFEDVGTGYLTDVQATFTLDAAAYGRTSAFDDAARGEQLLREWGYVEGYETGYIPEGYQTAVLTGRYYIHMEIHLFEDVEGARRAYRYFAERIDASGAQRVSVPLLGNEGAAWFLVQGTVPESTVPAVFHRYLLRRGNMVAIVATWGAQPFMRADAVITLAKMIDDKALGRRPAVVPTPIAAPATPTPGE
jgi:hypothetical protein